MTGIDKARAWWGGATRPAKIVAAVAGAITAACGAAVAVPTTWSVLGLPEVATRAHVAKEVARVEQAVEATGKALRASIGVSDRRAVDTQIEVFEIRRGLIEKELFDLDVSLGGSAAAGDDRLRGLLATRRTAVDGDRKVIDMRLDELRRARIYSGASTWSEAVPPK